ncbi:MAG TPA: HAD family phosphatase [Spirochaetia bacterium]|nr:HAD family phosphatase [Spirochaetia bacterium]
MALPRFDACIFDMDGLLLDTERLFVSCWMEAGAAMGFHLAEDLVLATVGLSKFQTFELLRSDQGQSFPAEEVRELRNRLALDRIRSTGVPVKPGARRLLGLLAARGVPYAVATSTDRARAIDLLTQSDILPGLGALVCGDEIEHPKPAPDIYLEAARQLDVSSAACIVFEDSAPGLTAAYRAGMVPIHVPDIGVVPEATRRLAYVVCESLTDVIPLIDDALRSRSEAN